MGRLRSFAVYLAAVALISTAHPVRAGSTLFEWNSPATGNWTDPTKWTPNRIPGETDPEDRVFIGTATVSGGTVILDSAVPPILSINVGDGGAGTLDIRPGASLTTGTTLSADAIGLNGSGTVLMSGGTVTLGRRLTVNRGLLDISGGAWQMPSPLGDLSVGLGGATELGQVIVRSTGELAIGRDFVLGDGGEGRFTQSGGDVNVARNLFVGGAGGVGAMIVSGGELNVDGSFSVGLLGDGTLTLDASTSAITAASFVAGPMSRIELMLGSTLSPIRATTATLDGELNVTLAGNPAVGSVYPLLRVGGNAPLATAFDDKPQGAVFLAAAPGDDVPLAISYQANLDGGAVANDATMTVLARGDVNLDGTVNRADLAALVANWHGSGGFAQGDLDGDGRVGLGDLMVFRRNFSPAAPSSAERGATESAAVPEPNGTVLLAVAAVACVWLRVCLTPRIGCKRFIVAQCGPKNEWRFPSDTQLGAACRVLCRLRNAPCSPHPG